MLNVSDLSRPSARDNASGMSTTDQLSARLSAFKSKFSDFVNKNTGRRHAGYDELNQGLMAGEDNDDSRAYGGGSGGYQGPVPGYESGAAATSGGVTSERAAASQSHVPSQAEEIVILASLAKDAAELLWEMVATEDLGDATQQMRDSAATIQAQLRGLIGDYQDPDEGALAAGLEAFDTLNNVLEEHTESATSPRAGASAAAPGVQFGSAPAADFDTGGGGGAAAAVAPPPAARQPAYGLLDDAPPPDKGGAEEKPLIEF
jgi:uncharacterized phage infection (PIP) family protein YhgE